MARRPLVTLAAGFSAAAAAARLLLPAGLAFWAGICFAAAFLVFILLSVILKRRSAVLLLAAAGLAAGFFWSAAHNAIFYTPAAALFGKSCEITATAADYSDNYEYSGRVLVALDKNEQTLYPAGTKAYLYYPGSTDIRPGDRVKAYVALGEPKGSVGFDARFYYRSKGIYLSAESEAAPVVTRPKGTGPQYLPAMLRRSILDKCGEVFTDDTAPILRALLLGDKSGISDGFSADVSDTGMSHVFAVSGMHLTYLTAVIFLFFKGRKGAIISLPVIIIFVAVTGFAPSIVRAGIMAVFSFAAVFLKREYDGITALFTALAAILAFSPDAAGDLGLWLSFFACLGILTLGTRLDAALRGLIKTKSRKLSRVFGMLVSNLAVTLAATVFTIPIIALCFGRISLVSPFVNLLTVWALSYAFAAALGAVAAGFLWVPLGVFIGYTAWPLVKFVVAAVSAFARLPVTTIGTANVFMFAWLLYAYVLFGLWFYYKREDKRPLLPACLAVVSLLAVLVLSSWKPDGAISAAVLNVGQGQSIVLERDGAVVVVDCGGSGKAGGNAAAAFLKSRNIARVDILFITHTHSDHINGVVRLLGDISVNRVILPALGDEDDGRAEIYKACETYGVEVTELAGDALARIGGLAFELYGFPRGGKAQELAVLADGGGEVLILGDIYASEDAKLAKEFELPDIEVLVAGHHGSKSATSEDILSETKPDAVVFSAGANNRYGHPSREAMERAQKSGAQLFRTDQNGDIIFLITESATLLAQ